jgi:hypothetical protein
MRRGLRAVSRTKQDFALQSIASPRNHLAKTPTQDNQPRQTSRNARVGFGVFAGSFHGYALLRAIRTTLLLASRLALIKAFPYTFIVVETYAWRIRFCCTPTGAPVLSSHERQVCGRCATPRRRTSRLPPSAPHESANDRRSEFCLLRPSLLSFIRSRC